MPIGRINTTKTHTPAHQPRCALAAGFSLVELVAVIVIVGILAVFAAPRLFDANVFQSRGFADQVQASLRYAQKAAIAQRRFVCTELAATSMTMTLDTTPPSAAHTVATCPGSNLAGPAGQPSNCPSATYKICAPSGITLTPATTIIFDALGRPTTGGQTISVGSNNIVVEAETGYVH